MRNVRIWRIGVFGLSGLVFVLLLWRVRDVLTPFYLAFFLAYLLSPTVGALAKRDIPRGFAIALVYLALILVIGSLIAFGIPEMFKETNKFAESLPRYAQELQNSIAGLHQRYRQGLPLGIVKAIDSNLLLGEAWLAAKLEAVIKGLVSLITSLPLFILAPILSIYLLYDWERFKTGLKRAIPRRWRGNAIHLGQEINFVTRRFIRGNLTVASLVGVMIGLGMKLIGMDYALLIGVISGLFDLIPYFGPVIGAVPALALALLKSPAMALRVLIVIVVVQQLESNFIQPKIVGDSVGLHPLMVVFVLLAGASLFGFWGMLLAVPAAGIIRVVLTFVYLKLV